MKSKDLNCQDFLWVLWQNNENSKLFTFLVEQHFNDINYINVGNPTGICRYNNKLPNTTVSIIYIFQFARLVHVTPGVHNTYLDNYVTVFAPTNDALDSYEGDLNEEFILNHFGSVAMIN